MPALVKISHGAISTSSLFSESNNLLFVIRPPQRRFKWKKEQIEQLWDDIVRAHKADRDSYFLGTLLLVPHRDGGLSVIDGQQRITTLSILLAVLRDHCRNFSSLKTRSDGIQRLIRRVDNDGRPVGALVVTLQDTDNQTYMKWAKDHGSTEPPFSQDDPISSAVKTLSNKVTNYLNVPNPEDSLRGICEYIQSKVMFLPLEVRSESEAYLVFDTTNTRGMRLSPSEALKARLAAIAREDSALSEELIRTWAEVAGKLEDAGLPIDAMDDYLHAIWCAKEGYIAKRSLGGIASRFRGTEDLKAFVEYMESYILSYLAVVAPSGTSSIDEDLKDLRHLNVQSYSFLTMVHKNSFNRFPEAVNLVLSLQMRNITVGDYQANEYEKQWPHWARLVREGDTQEAFDEIRALMVSDEYFQQTFEKKDVSAAGIVRHVLRRLDPISHPGSGVQPTDVDVEHVLPKSVVSKLKDDKSLTTNVKQWILDLGYEIPETSEEKLNLGKELEPYLNMLGNQALLDDRTNRGVKDLPFDKKKDCYQGQGLELTKSLADHEKWEASQILARQKEMAQQAPLVWTK